MRNENDSLRNIRYDQGEKIKFLEAEKLKNCEEILKLKSFIDENLAGDEREKDIFQLQETKHKQTLELLKEEIKILETENSKLHKTNQNYEESVVKLDEALERVSELENERKMWQRCSKDSEKGEDSELSSMKEKVVKKLNKELANLKSANINLETKVEKLESELRKSSWKMRQMSAKKAPAKNEILSNSKEMFKMQTPIKSQMIFDQISMEKKDDAELGILFRNQNKKIAELEEMVGSLKKIIGEVRLKKNKEIRVLCNIIYDKYLVDAKSPHDGLESL